MVEGFPGELVLSRAALQTDPRSEIVGAVSQLALPDDDVTVDPRYRLPVLTVAWLLSLSSADTQRAYFGDLAQWLHWCRRTALDPLQARRADVDLWKSGLTVTDRRTGTLKPASPATVRRKLAGISAWYAYLESNDRAERNPVSAVKRPKATSRPGPALALSDAAVLLDQAESRARTNQSEASWRDAALVGLYVHTAVRVSAVLNADIEDYTTDEGFRVLRYVKKGGGHDVVRIEPGAAHLLDTYLDLRAERSGVRRDELTGPLAATAPHLYDPSKTGGRRLTQRDVTNTLQTIAARAGLPVAISERLSAHWLRRGAGTGLLGQDVPLPKVQDFLAHASPVTTRDHYDATRHKLRTSPAGTLATLIAEHRDPSAARPAGTIHQIKAAITEVGAAGPWRRLHLPSHRPLGHLHQALAIAFGWPPDTEYRFTGPDGLLAATERMDALPADFTFTCHLAHTDRPDLSVDLQLETVHRPRAGVSYPRCSDAKGSITDPRTPPDLILINRCLVEAFT